MKEKDSMTGSEGSASGQKKGERKDGAGRAVCRGFRGWCGTR